MKTKHLLKWHKRFGLISALVVILLSITGIALNHTEDLALDQNFVQQKWLNHWYGIQVPEVKQAYAINQDWVFQAENQIFYNHKKLINGKLIGAVPTKFGSIIALENKALLIDQSGQLIDLIPYPKSALRLLTDNQRIYFLLNDLKPYHADDNWTKLIESPTRPEQVVLPITPIPATLQMIVAEATFNQALTWERVALDIHSGRFFGAYGHWVMDVFAILFLVLAFSGFWVYWRRRK